MNKKRAVALIMITTLTGVSYTGAFAADESCKTCTSTSPVIDKYIEFSYEIIQTLQTIANERKPSSTQINSESNVLDRIANNLNQKWQTAVTFSVLMWTIGKQIVASSARQELQVMVNSKALMRDREKLDQLDQDIADTLFDMGDAWVFIANVQDYKQRIKTVFEKYAQWQDAFIEVTWDPSSSATVLIAALWDLNQAYKRFIAGGNTDWFNVFSEKYWSELGISLTAVNYESLQQEYSCTRWINKCDTTYKKFGANMSEIGENVQDETKEAIKTITNAVERLKCAFAKQSNVKCQQSWFKDKQNDLLRGLYGLEWPMANKAWVNALANSMDRLGNSLKTQINDVKDFYTKNDNQSTPITLPATAAMDVSKPDIASKQWSDDLYADLMWATNETLAQSRKGWQQHVMADPLVVTRNIPRVSIMVYNSINIIGDAQKAKSITQNLGKACENQCSNLWGTCYY